MQVDWSDPALDDLTAIREYYENKVKNPIAAFKVGRAILAAGDALEILPARGKRRRDGSYVLTTLVARRNYGLVYDIDEAAQLVTILHVRTMRTRRPRPAAYRRRH